MSDVKQYGGKRGRKELRSIRKTGYNKRFKKQDETIEETNDDDSNSDSEHEELVAIDKELQVTQDLEKKKMVYDSLLTILNSEHPSKSKKGKKFKSGSADVVEESEEDEVDLEEEIDENLNQPAAIEDDDEQDAEINSDSEDENDPFESHFNNVTEDFINKYDSDLKNKLLKNKSLKKKLSDKETFTHFKKLEEDSTDSLDFKIKSNNFNHYFMKQRLTLNNDLINSPNEKLSELQKTLINPIFQYNDLLYEYENYGSSEEEYRNLYSIHILNHIFKTRDHILKNNSKLSNNNDIECLDQGFTRPKVLIIAPTRSTAYSIIDTIIKNSNIDQIDQKGKFNRQFFDDSLPPDNKPESFKNIFKGNTNDFFIMGMKFTRKSIKLFSNFYQSDIIVTSPLGLQMIVENTDKKKKQDDFLSSIEITIIDQLHSIEFQNMSHITTIFDHLNNIPKNFNNNIDFSRIRHYYINDQSKLIRQNMIFTKYISPNANFLINNKCLNFEGKFKNHKYIDAEESAIAKLGLRIKQHFQKFTIVDNSIVDEPTYRFKFFTSVILQSIIKSTNYEDGHLIYIPDYTDFIRIRNYLKEKTTILFGDINEYSSQKQLTANRTLFQQGRLKVLLYTERLHHFRRYEIKGVKNVIFYKPPTNPEFYTEVVRFIGKNAYAGNCDINISTVRTIYSKLDTLFLERVVGSKRTAILTRGQNENFEFK